MNCEKGCKQHPGVYTWRNIVTGAMYVGSSLNCADRRGRSHAKRLSRNLHRGKHFQRAWNKYGEAMFEFEVMRICAPELARVYEQLYINAAREVGIKLYNVWNVNEYTLEQCAKISEANRGKIRSEETRIKQSIVHTGKKLSEVTRTKMRNRRHSAETKAKMSIDRKGKKRPPGTGAKISAANRGKKPSTETRQKMSIAKQGVKRPAEVCAKIGAASKGRKQSVETRQKRTASIRLFTFWRSFGLDPRIMRKLPKPIQDLLVAAKQKPKLVVCERCSEHPILAGAK